MSKTRRIAAACVISVFAAFAVNFMSASKSSAQSVVLANMLVGQITAFPTGVTAFNAAPNSWVGASTCSAVAIQIGPTATGTLSAETKENFIRLLTAAKLTARTVRVTIRTSGSSCFLDNVTIL